MDPDSQLEVQMRYYHNCSAKGINFLLHYRNISQQE